MNPIRLCAQRIAQSTLMITAALSVSAHLAAQDQAEEREAGLRAAIEGGIDAFADREFGAARRAFAEARPLDAPLAHFFTGLMHQHGLGGPYRFDQADAFLTAAAERRVIPAMYALAELAYRRDDVDSEKKWLRQAAEFGHGEAQAMLARRLIGSSDASEKIDGARFATVAHESGRLDKSALKDLLEQFLPGELDDLQDRVDALKATIAQNLNAGIYRIDMPWDDILQRGTERPGVIAAKLYADGELVEAFEALKPLAEAGDTTGCFYLARMYHQKLTRELNQGRAAFWYTQAALADDESSMRNLAWMLLEGEHVEADPAAARDLLLRASLLGYGSAMYDLGYVCREGKAGEVDLVEACAWYRLAVESGESSAESDYDQVAMKLGSPELERVHRRLDELRKRLARGVVAADLPLVPYLEAARRKLAERPQGSVSSKAVEAGGSETGSGRRDG